MPDLDATEHRHDLTRAAPTGGAALASPQIRRVSLSSAGGWAVLRHLDVVLVVLATPVALAMDVPNFGYLVGAIAWIAQSVIARADKRLVVRAAEPRTRLGISLFDAFGRIWLLAGAIVLAGVAGGRRDGLSAALVIFAAYSVAFAIRVLSGRPSRPAGREPAR